MKRTILNLTALLLVLIISTTTVIADKAFETAGEKLHFPDISAKSYVLADAKTGEVIFSHNENSRMPIASTTKVMTCLVALENSKLDDVVTVSAESTGIEGSSIYLYEGEKITVEDLLYALMLESANDSAVCLAEHISGSVDGFSKLMNEKASELGLKNSCFANPHGLEDPEHYSTALDMSRVWCEAMKNETFRKIVATKTYKIELGSDDGYRFLSNHNRLLKTFEPCIGGKTGYTKTAGRCLISAVEQNGVELVMVTLNDPNDWADHKALMEYALSLYTTMEVAENGTVSHVVPVVGGKEKSVKLVNVDGLSLTLRDVTKLEVTVSSPRFVYAPVKDTALPIAEVIYSVDGNVVAKLPLYPENTVETLPKQSFLKKIINIFK